VVLLYSGRRVDGCVYGVWCGVVLYSGVWCMVVWCMLCGGVQYGVMYGGGTVWCMMYVVVEWSACRRLCVWYGVVCGMMWCMVYGGGTVGCMVYGMLYGVWWYVGVQWSACRRLCALSSDDWFYVVDSLASHVDLQQVQHHHCFVLPHDAL